MCLDLVQVWGGFLRALKDVDAHFDRVVDTRLCELQATLQWKEDLGLNSVERKEYRRALFWARAQFDKNQRLYPEEKS